MRATVRWTNMATNDAFMLFFKGLARHAPGDDDATLTALAACELPASPTIYDLGAGTGSSTLILAEQLETRVVAVDQMQQSLDELATRAERRGIDQWVDTLNADFMHLDVVPGTVDLIWCEGSIYAPGWESALESWGGLLRDGGYLVVTDCVWATDEPPQPAAEFWAREYPGMKRSADITALATASGFELVTSFPLPPHAWSDYYGPLAQRVALVESSGAAAEMKDVAAAVKEEVEMWEEHGQAVDYVFFVLRR